MLAVTSKANRCALPFLIIHLVIFREREREGERERNIDVMCKSPLSQPGPLPFKKKKVSQTAMTDLRRRYPVKVNGLGLPRGKDGVRVQAEPRSWDREGQTCWLISSPDLQLHFLHYNLCSLAGSRTRGLLAGSTNEKQAVRPQGEGRRSGAAWAPRAGAC